ncbi:uncharacterized protein F4812DRAFT_464851 [Daldinia caldariorum]|uniref:uncharacterized protein n=1 Tax=Daldinia caldariorum TaxID=326644 RepID=UPI002008A2F4|nr:uncharacterized protein F4812DRAFT_464851 [Daldinia caldariorum]KAI1472800.1 hypothetical protein F4812DRAFT_464851 [Daldinia caldariorum]
MEFTSPYDDYQKALDYDFHTEVAPGIWTVCTKLDRTILLAHDITEVFTGDSDSDSTSEALSGLLSTNTVNLFEKIAAILNHDNLICLRDWFSVAKLNPKSREYEKRTFIVWDNCDAGTLENLLVEEYEKYTPDQEADKRPSTSGTDGKSTSSSNKSKLNSGTDEKPSSDTEMSDVRKVDPPTKFLPESLCWHVLISVLKALAWLHDGSPELVATGPGRFGMDPTPDWNPALHRNITPANIHFQQPRRNETYGQCKLGNYSSLYLSSHHNGDGKSNVERVRAKALVPRPEGPHQHLDELIQQDAKYGYTYKEQSDQPYTVLSGWRALGEILQAMMIPPSGTKTNVEEHIQNVAQHGVRYNLQNADYSAALKNIVVRLMTLNPDEKLKDGNYRFPNRDTLTSNLCVLAFGRYRLWREFSPEGQEVTTVEHERVGHAAEDASAAAEAVAATLEMYRAVDSIEEQEMEKGPWRLDDHMDGDIDVFEDSGVTTYDMAHFEEEMAIPYDAMLLDENWEFDD